MLSKVKNVVLKSLIIMLITISTVQARDYFNPGRELPIWLIKNNNYLLTIYFSVVPGGSGSIYHKHEKVKSWLMKYDLKTREITKIEDPAVTSKVNCLIKNESFIFAGGRGLSVYNIKTKKWEAWDEFNKQIINYMCIDNNNLWLGTEQGVWGININTREIIKHFTTQDGLKTNRIMSVFAQDKMLLVSTYRGKHDIIGEGLSKLNLATDEIQEMVIPKPSKPYDYRKLPYAYGVISMYAVPDNKIRMVFYEGFPPYKVYDYSYATNEFFPLQTKHHHLDKIFKEKSIASNSESAMEIIELISEVYLNWSVKPNHIAEETVDILYKNEKHTKIKELLKHAKPYVREQTLYYLSKYKDAWIDKELIIALNDRDSVVLQSVISAIEERKISKAAPKILQIIKSNSSSDYTVYSAVSCLAEIGSKDLVPEIEKLISEEKDRSMLKNLREARDKLQSK